MKKGLKIIFFGTPDFAIESLDSLYNSYHELLCVVTSSDKKSGRGMKINLSEVKKYSIENDLKLLQPQSLNDEEFITELKQYQADLFVVVAFKFLRKKIWEIPKLGTINIHASLLPNLRGAAPINWALINGLKETGLTSFFINEKIDSGDIILQEKLAIYEHDNFESLYKKLKKMSNEFITKTIELIFEDNITTQKQQKIKNLLLAPKLNKHNTRVNWNDSATNIYNFVRGLSPFPCAWTIENKTNKRVLIYDVSMGTSTTEKEIGKISLKEPKKLSIITKEGTIEIKQLKIEGKKSISGSDYLNGNYKSEIKFI